MLPGGINAENSNSVFGKMIEDGEMISLPSAYFRKIEKLIGKDQLKEDENVVIAIWKDDMPVKILTVIDGELVDTDGAKKYPNKNQFQTLNLIEDEFKNTPINGEIYDVAVYEDDFIFYE